MTHNTTDYQPKHDTDWHRILIDTVKTIDRNTYQCLYVVDFTQSKFLYVSENLAKYCGHYIPSASDSFTYNDFMQALSEKDRETGYEILDKKTLLASGYKPQELLECTIACDFSLNDAKRKRMINQKLSPISIAEDGSIGLALAVIDISSTDKPGNIVLSKADDDFYLKYSLDTHKWEKTKKFALTETERDILRLSAQGITMEGIADLLCKSLDTIKSHKRNLFAKIGATNISQALASATNYELL